MINIKLGIIFVRKSVYFLIANDYHWPIFNYKKLLLKTLPQASDHPEPSKKDNTCIPLRLKSQDIFKQQNNIVIEHHGEEYHLKLTKQNKLILTKWVDIDANILNWNWGVLIEPGWFQPAQNNHDLIWSPILKTVWPYQAERNTRTTRQPPSRSRQAASFCWLNWGLISWIFEFLLSPVCMLPVFY